MEASILPGSLEWWHVLFSIVGIAFTVAVKSFGVAFKHWGDKLDDFQDGVNKRLEHMESNVANRISALENKFNTNEEKWHRLTLHVERRVTWIEARMGLPETPRWPMPADERLPDDEKR